MAVTKGILAKVVNGVYHHIFPKTSSDMVLHGDTTVEQMLNDLNTNKISIDKETGKGLSSNDFTNELKGNLETVYRDYLTDGYTENVEQRLYAVQKDSNKHAYVHVPWVAYSEATINAAGLMSAADKQMLNDLNTSINGASGGSSGGSTPTIASRIEALENNALSVNSNGQLCITYDAPAA